MTYREMVAWLERQGWVKSFGKGSHLVLRHPSSPKIIAFPYNHPNTDISKGTLGRIKRITKLCSR
jgi:predicted RNA binding protein YcfA (HicA-like mRNA interferase family)